MVLMKFKSDQSYTAEVAGDQFSKYVTLYQNRLFRFILKMVSRVSVAEELTQEAFLQAYRHIGSFKGNSNIFTWLAGIGLNLARNHLKRSDERRQELVADEELFHGVAGDDDPFRAYEKKEFLENLHTALTSLPSDLQRP